MIEEVRRWFADGCHFGTGMTLLARTGANPKVFAEMNVFMSGKYSYVPDAVKARLRHELKEWIKQQPKNVAAPKARMTENPTNVVKTVKVQEPDVIQQLRAKARPLHKKHSVLHEAMRNAKTDSEAYEIEVEIMEKLLPELDGIYDQIRKWEKEGVLPDEPGKADIVRETVAKMKKINSLKPRISRLKTKLKDSGFNDTERQKLEIELLDKEHELKALKTELSL